MDDNRADCHFFAGTNLADIETLNPLHFSFYPNFSKTKKTSVDVQLMKTHL